MGALSLYNSEGKKIKEVEVHPELFSGPVRKGLLYYIVRYQLASRRAGTHSSKTRGMVSGSTRKIYRQKGTGRARHGDRKAPIFVGGGKVFGPHPRDYSYTVPKTARRRGLQSALLLKKKEDKMFLVELPKLSEPKTRKAVEFFKTLDVKSALIVVDSEQSQFEKSVRNLPFFKVIPVVGLNVYDILNHEHLLVTEGAMDKIVGRLHLLAS